MWRALQEIASYERAVWDERTDAVDSRVRLGTAFGMRAPVLLRSDRSPSTARWPFTHERLNTVCLPRPALHCRQHLAFARAAAAVKACAFQLAPGSPELHATIPFVSSKVSFPGAGTLCVPIQPHEHPAGLL